MTDGPEPQPPEPATERDIDQPRLHFHLALAAILVPCASPIVSGALTIVNLTKRIHHPRHRLWTKRLAMLTFVDIAVCAAFFAFTALHEGSSAQEKAAPLRIGAMFEREANEPTRIRSVLEGSPSEEAGLQPGDRLDAIDGQPMTSLDDIRAALQAAAPGKERTLTIERDGEALERTVLPARSFTPRNAELFEPHPGYRQAHDVDRDLLDLIPPAGIILFAAIYSLIKGKRAFGTWTAFVLVMAGAYGGVYAISFAMDGALGGTSRGLILLLLNTQMILLLGGAGLASWLLRKSPTRASDPTPPLTPVKTLLLAILYFVGGGLRLMIPLFVASTLLFDGAAAPQQPLEQLASAPLGTLGVLLFVLATVFLGPVAEELLFRGFLLPRLAAQISTRWGLWISATLFGLLHLHYMLLVPVVIYYGLVFGWARMRSGSLFVPILLHMGVNALATTVHLLR